MWCARLVRVEGNEHEEDSSSHKTEGDTDRREGQGDRYGEEDG
jgi:hypothetical protein